MISPVWIHTQQQEAPRDGTWFIYWAPWSIHPVLTARWVRANGGFYCRMDSGEAKFNYWLPMPIIAKEKKT